MQKLHGVLTMYIGNRIDNACVNAPKIADSVPLTVESSDTANAF